MRVLIVYASKYGATRGIAERIAARLTAAGHTAEIATPRSARSLEGYDAFVIGSAAYIGSWLKPVADFVRGNADVLASRPVWLFSSGPVGTRTVDDAGRDVRENAAPKEFAEFDPLLHPRGKHVFYGAMDHTRFTLGHKLVFAMPAMKKVMVDGDYRDWPEIERWADEIAAALTPAGVS